MQRPEPWYRSVVGSPCRHQSKRYPPRVAASATERVRVMYGMFLIATPAAGKQMSKSRAQAAAELHQRAHALMKEAATSNSNRAGELLQQARRLLEEATALLASEPEKAGPTLH